MLVYRVLTWYKPRLTLVVVVKVGVGNGDPLRSVSHIKKTIVVVLVVVKVR